MPRHTSSTGLIAARVRPVQRPEPQKLDLIGASMPAPFTLRPFAGLYNPYPYGCSVLCNHPADGDAKEVVRRAKETRASEGKALLLPGEMELIRASLLRTAAAVKQCNEQQQQQQEEANANATVPEELFRRYTETDSRPASPADELTSDSHHAHEQLQVVQAKERVSLVLDLRASSHEIQESETLSWHALTLEPIPSSRRSDLSVPPVSTRRKTPISSRRHRSSATLVSSSPARSVPVLEISDATSTRSAPTNLVAARSGERDDDDDDDEETSPDESPTMMRRRGKLRRKKRKCRRGSIYGQQTEVREPPDPLETQVSQIDEASRRGSLGPRLEEAKQASLDKSSPPIIKPDAPPSFLPPEILKELGRELDREMVECEFNAKRRYALEETLRVIGEAGRGPRSSPVSTISQSVPRLFYRQSARFELLDSQSLVDLKPLEYLARHVYASDSRKLTFSRVFNRYREPTTEGPRFLLAVNLYEALHEVLGRQLGSDDVDFLESSVGEIWEKLDFRSWCGICAFAERTLVDLPSREQDPASWLERADFEMLERRLRNAEVDERLAEMLRMVRDR